MRSATQREPSEWRALSGSCCKRCCVWTCCVAVAVVVIDGPQVGWYKTGQLALATRKAMSSMALLHRAALAVWQLRLQHTRA